MLPLGGRPPLPTPQPPGLRLRLRPFLFAGVIVVLSVGALLILFLQGDTRSDDLSEAEVEALVLSEPPETTPLPPLWTTPSQPSDLSLTTDPVGAAVQINGEWVGTTPIRFDDFRPGFYSVSFYGANSARVDTSFYLASGSFLHLDVPFQPIANEQDAAPLERVPSAVARGAAPQRTAPQARRLLDQPGRPSGGGTPPPDRPAFETVSPDQLQRVAHTGSLSITSNPFGAEVLVDGAPFGRAPLSISGLRPGAYVVTLSLPGRTPISYRAEVRAQAVSVVKATFPRPSDD